MLEERGGAKASNMEKVRRLVMPKTKRKAKAAPDLAARLDLIDQKLDALLGMLYALPRFVQPAADVPPTSEVFRSGRWHLRDGAGYGRPPYYADNQTRHLRSADLGVDRHQGGRKVPGGAVAEPEDRD